MRISFLLGSASNPYAPIITAASMQKIQECLEAQRNFVKYYEFTERFTLSPGSQAGPSTVPDILTTEVRRRRSGSEQRTFQPYSQRNGWVEESAADQRPAEDNQQQPSADSDKENSSAAVTAAWTRRARKVAKLSSSGHQLVARNGNTASPGLQGMKRKSPSEESRSSVPEKLSKVDKECLTDSTRIPAIDEATQTDIGPPAASKVMLMSRKRIVGQLEPVDSRQNVNMVREEKMVVVQEGGTVGEVPDLPATRGTREEEREEDQKRPWRTNMKTSTTTGSKPNEGIITADKNLPEHVVKPWRVNMKPITGGDKIEATAEVVPKNTADVEEKPWRKNMKKLEDKPATVVVSAAKKQRHIDPEVKEYMLKKKMKDKALQEEATRQEHGNS